MMQITHQSPYICSAQIPLSAATRTKKLKHKEDRHVFACDSVVDLSDIHAVYKPGQPHHVSLAKSDRHIGVCVF
jgi:hypothetical protein